MRVAARRRVLRCATLVGLVLPLACGDGEARIVVRKPAAQRPDIDAGLASKGTLSIPAAAAFNYTSYKSGQTGEARGKAEPAGPDGASCRAEASGEGTAWGQFLLGYCFDNATESPLEAVVKLRLVTAESIAAKRPDAGAVKDPATAMNGRLEFFIKDSNGLIVRRENLLTDSFSTGPRSAEGKHELAFDATFEPGRGYYLMIAGHVDVEAAPGESVIASLGVSSCELEIAWQQGPFAASSERGPESAEASNMEAAATAVP